MYSFVYSNNIKFRLFRHIIFWVAWISYFITIYVLRPGSYSIGFRPFLSYTILETLIVMSVDIVFCYTVMYFLVPRYLIKGKYILFFLFLVIFILLDASVSNLYYYVFINPLREYFDLMPWEKITFPQLLLGMSSVLMITWSATTIRFLKLWHLKQQEIDLLKSEKISKEMKFIDTYIQPSFVPLLLKKVYSFSVASSHKVPEMLERMQRILSYLIDECNHGTVLISREIDAIKDFLQLEKLTNSGRFTINYDLNTDAGNKRIVPFILFPLIENNFRQVNDNITDNHWVNITLAIADNNLTLEIKNSKPVETSNLMNYETSNLQQIRKRLELLYPESHKLHIIIEEETFIIRLEIALNRVVI
jgi:LytS/YehU family sensor histidine kinase